MDTFIIGDPTRCKNSHPHRIHALYSVSPEKTLFFVFLLSKWVDHVSYRVES
jgi:hypothetical protein